LKSILEQERKMFRSGIHQCERRPGLGRVMAKLKGTSETAIAMAILTSNLTRLLAAG
jgi:hypothetical protein